MDDNAPPKKILYMEQEDVVSKDEEHGDRGLGDE